MSDTLATTMAARLDHHMFDRYREIKNIAAFPTLQQIWERDPSDIRTTLELVQSSFRNTLGWALRRPTATCVGNEGNA
jgi:hypothetical protein